MQFFGFHLMPWPYLPESHVNSLDSTWVTLSNAEFDPERGGALYNRYLDELVAYDEAGFDGVCVNEHHQNAYGLMPSPNLFAAMLVHRTRGKIALLGNALSLRDHPLRVAEEVAILDVVSGGRMISGFVRGIGAEYYSMGLDPTASRDRFLEAHDLVVKAWTTPGPFEWYGKHYKFRYVNPWPRPLQQPHPPIWSPSQGSGETIEWAAEHRYTYLQTFTEARTLAGIFGDFRAAAERHGYTAPPEQLGWALPIYVGETDASAMAEARPHLDYFFNALLRMPKEMLFPNGYMSATSAARVMASKSGLGSGQMGIDDLIERGFALVGSPETITDRLRAYESELGFGTLVAIGQFGTLGHEAFTESLARFSEQVMPKLRGPS